MCDTESVHHCEISYNILAMLKDFSVTHLSIITFIHNETTKFILVLYCSYFAHVGNIKILI